MKIDLFDKNGKATQQIELDASVFGVEPNMVVLKQYIDVYTANQRQGTSSTKTRSEVSGGGKKPWKQKGTGRARVGSSRNPLWRHGGIAHGPKPKSWSKRVTKKLRRLALVSALSLKASSHNLIVIDNLKLAKFSTPELLKVLTAVKYSPRRTLVVLDTNDLVVRKSASNIPGVETSQVENLNAYEVLLSKKVVLVKNTVEALEKKYAKTEARVKKEKQTKEVKPKAVKAVKKATK